MHCKHEWGHARLQLPQFRDALDRQREDQVKFIDHNIFMFEHYSLSILHAITIFAVHMGAIHARYHE